MKKVIVDTSIWVEFLKKNPKIFPSVRVLLENDNAIAMECIFGELLQGAKSGREREIISSYWENLRKIDETGIWVKAGIYYGKNNLAEKGAGLIDSVLLVAASINNLIVWTLDKKLNNILPDRCRYQ